MRWFGLKQYKQIRNHNDGSRSIYTPSIILAWIQPSYNTPGDEWYDPRLPNNTVPDSYFSIVRSVNYMIEDRLLTQSESLTIK